MKPIAAPTRPLTLVTDLDGTFLAGPDADRIALRDLFAGVEGAVLVFATGRSVTSVERLLADDPLLPRPDYVIGDVGSSVVHGARLDPVQPLQDEIAARWPGDDRVRSALSDFDGLELQDVPQSRRCSFVAAESRVTQAVLDTVARLGCDALFSHGRYLDVLPRGVSKGTTLRRLAAREGFAPDGVVVAGDSLNDLSLFDAGYAGIVVGNAESGLRRQTASHPSNYTAGSPGAAGIREGLGRHGFVAAPHDG